MQGLVKMCRDSGKQIKTQGGKTQNSSKNWKFKELQVLAKPKTQFAKNLYKNAALKGNCSQPKAVRSLFILSQLNYHILSRKIVSLGFLYPARLHYTLVHFPDLSTSWLRSRNLPMFWRDVTTSNLFPILTFGANE